MKSIYLGLIIMFFGCQNQGNQQNVVKENLVRNFLQSELAVEMKSQQGKLYILKNEYCERVDCESYFKDFEDKIEVLSKETVFMRGANNTLVISKIDEKNGMIKAKKLTFQKRKK